jgi:high-affinity nickel permease
MAEPEQTSKKNGFFAKLWQDVEPVVAHSLVMAVVLFFAAVGLVVASVVQRLVPSAAPVCEIIKQIDLLAIVCLASLYATYMVVIVAKILWKSLMSA